MEAVGLGKAWWTAGPVGAAVGGVIWMLDTPFEPAKELLKKAKPGDLIEFDRVKFKHWAMYSDQPGYIINIPAEGKDKTEVTIKLEKLLDVARDSKVRINNHDKVATKLGYKKRSQSEALAAAKADLGRTLPYNFLRTNCEYYSTKWLYGNGFSVQVNQAEAGIVGTGIAAHLQGAIGAVIGTIFGGPLGGVIGYITATGVVGLGMSTALEAAGTTHYTR